jgi:hypothetical protein
MRIEFGALFLTSGMMLLSAFAPGQSAKDITVPVEFRQDFEEGHISGWESYPPFQDSAFDPDFKCTRDNNRSGSRFALTRRVQISFQTEYEIGFIRKVRLFTTKTSTVSFSYLLKMFGDVKKLDVVLCGLDGRTYTYTIPAPKNDVWQTVTVAAASLKDSKGSLSPGQEVEALYFLAHIEKTNPDAGYRFFLDDVAVSGEAPVQFEIRSPKTTVLEHWNKTVLHEHYTPGATLSLTVSLPSPVTLTSTRFFLKNPRGAEVLGGVSLSFRRETNLWEHPALYTFSDDEKGRWRGSLRGEDRQGRLIETEFDVWVSDKSQPHPRLYFGADNIDFYRSRLEEPKWKSWFDTLAARAARLETTSNLGSIVFDTETSSQGGMSPEARTLHSMARADVGVYDTTHLLPTLNHYYGVMQPAMEILYGHALLYAVKGDRRAGDYARSALLAIAGWESWTHPWFRARHQESYYPVGELGVRAALCYDAVYALLSPDERKAVREGLLRNCVIPVYREYVVENRIPSSTSNWIGNSTAGALSCILAMYGDTLEGREYEPYFSGLLAKLEHHLRSTLDTSGAWGEGASYQSFAYSNVMPTITALDRVLHADITTAALLRSYLYFLYNSSSSEILDVGDSHPTLSTLSSFAWIVSRTDDPLFRWLYNTGPRDQGLDFLFGRESGRSTPPDSLPRSRVFTEIGGVVFRSGWSPDDLLMNFRCGPFFNHQHFDQGSFQLRAFGETLIPEAGSAHYYNDPWYQPYYIQAAGHNTVLLDGNPGSQRSGDYLHFVKAADARAELREVVVEDYYAAATGRLDRLYRGNLKLFERNVVFVQPDYFVLFDRLRSNGKAHTYNWLLHFDEKKDVRVSGRDISIKRGRASLLAKVLSPENAIMDVQGGPVRLGVPITHPGYVQVSNASNSTEENFLVVLYPQRRNPTDRDAAGDDTRSLSDAIESLHGRNHTGARVTRDGASDEVLFRIDDNKGEIGDGPVITDGRIAARTTRGGQIQMLAVHDATYLTCDGVKWVGASPGPAAVKSFTVAAAFDADGAEWEIRADGTGSMTFRSPRAPIEVNLNGVKIPSPAWDERSQLLTIFVSQGKNKLTARY